MRIKMKDGQFVLEPLTSDCAVKLKTLAEQRSLVSVTKANAPGAIRSPRPDPDPRQAL